jgi:hypothetical protein
VFQFLKQGRIQMVATARRPRGNNKKVSNAKRDEFIRDNAGMRLHGEIITWGLDAQVHTHATVLQALRDSNLSTEPAKEILPRHAFTRASKKLVEDKVIDEIGHDGPLMSFQFTKRQLQGKEMKYTKDCILILNRDTGTIECEDKSLEKMAQGLLDKAIENRTTADITKIIQKLFDAEADLFPIRDQGGVYFVPIQFQAFVEKVELFVGKLGGRVNRFPVPADTKQGDQSIQDAVVNGLSIVVRDLEEATNGFDINTRGDTIKKQSEKIKSARVKVEAYANYLKDKAEEMLDAVDIQNDKLRNQIKKIEKDRLELPEDERGRTLIFGQSVVAIIRWMGKNDWEFEEARKVLDSYNAVIKDSTIKIQLSSWESRGGAPKLTDEQEKELNKLKGAK